MPLNPGVNLYDACYYIDPDAEVQSADGETIDLWESTVHPTTPTDDEINTAYADLIEAGVLAEWLEAAGAIANSPLSGQVTDQAGASSDATIKLAELGLMFSNEALRSVPNILLSWDKLKAMLLGGVAAGNFVLTTEVITAWNQMITDYQLPTRMMYTV